MYWFRSWPAADVPEANPHVVDDMPRLLMRDFDYATVSPTPYSNGHAMDWDTIGNVAWPSVKPGLCLLEWDVALDPAARYRFLGEALTDPRRPLAAPYLLGEGHACRTLEGEPVPMGATECDTFGFGCTYLPYPAVRRFLEEANTNGFTDSTFSRWYHANYGPARVTWAVSPQHLHAYTEWQ